MLFVASGLLAHAGTEIENDLQNAKHKMSKAPQEAKLSITTMYDGFLRASFNFQCPNGNVVVGCCYDSHQEAYEAGQAAYVRICGQPVPGN